MKTSFEQDEQILLRVKKYIGTFKQILNYIKSTYAIF